MKKFLFCLGLLISSFAAAAATELKLDDGKGGSGVTSISQTGANTYDALATYSNYHLGDYVVNGTVRSNVKVEFSADGTFHLSELIGQLALQYVMQDPRYPDGSVTINASSEIDRDGNPRPNGIGVDKNGVITIPLAFTVQGDAKPFVYQELKFTEKDYVGAFYGLR